MIEKVETFGDVRTLIIETVMQIRDGGLEPNQANAMAMQLKLLNDNLQVEINAAKLYIQAEKEGHKIGKLVRLGRRMIDDNSNDPDESSS